MGPRVDFLVRRLDEEGEAMLARLRAFTPSEWTEPIYDEGPRWTVRDVLAHLVSAERAFHRLIADVANGGSGVPADFDYDAFNAAEVQALAGRPAEALVTDLQAARAEMIDLVAGLADEDLDRRGLHPALGEGSLDDFIMTVYRHAKIHMRDVARRRPRHAG